MIGKEFSDYPASVRVGIMAGLALLLAGAAGWFLVLPVYRDCTAAADQLKQLKAQNEANRALKGQIAILQKRVSEAGEKLQEVKSMVPDAPDADSIVNLIRQAESSSGVHVRSVAAQAPVPAEEYVELPFKVHVDGTYFGLLAFFDSLSRTSRIVNVTAFGLGIPTSTGRGAFKISLGETVGSDFVLSAYCNKAPGTAPAAKKP